MARSGSIKIEEWTGLKGKKFELEPTETLYESGFTGWSVSST